MSKRRKMLIAIADGEHARFLRPSEDGALLEEAVFQSPSAHLRSAELRTDHPGASFHSDSSAHHALAPQIDPKRVEKESFAEAVAGRLNAEAAKGAFDDLVLVAPQRSLNAIRRHLTPETAACVVGKLAKDLIKIPDAKLWVHLGRWLPPTRQSTK
jgi:protein required for attachment to host cells